MTTVKFLRGLSAAVGFSLVSIAPASATNILILADNPGTATSSCEYKIVTTGVCGTTSGLGWTATVVAPGTGTGQWSTQAYGSFDAIVLSSCCTYGSLATFSAAGGPEINAAAWAAAVPGNVVVIGTDPNVHTGATQGGPELIKSAIQVAASGAKPGAVIILNGLYYAAAANTPVPVLAGFESTTGGNCGTGKFGVQKTNLEDAHKIVIHPALNGLTDALLSNWHQSSHNGFNCWPSSFTPLAILTDLPSGDPRLIWTGTDVETGSSVKGFPYIVARGVTPAGPPRPVECCPPLDKPTFTGMLSEVSTGGIMDPYVVKAMTNATFDLQMQNYFNYVSSLDTTISGVDIFLFLIDCNDNNNPSSSACAGSIMPGVKMLTWNAASALSSTPNAPWRSEWIPSWTNSCAPAFNSNCIPWAQIFDNATQPSSVNHRYEIVAITAVERTNGTREALWRCPILIHQVNHKQSLMARQAPTSATNAVGIRTFEQTQGGKRIIEEFRKISRSLLARPLPINGPAPQQQPEPHGGDRP
jgi:hypothetical protein